MYNKEFMERVSNFTGISLDLLKALTDDGLDIYSAIAKEKQVDRAIVKRDMHALMYSTGPQSFKEAFPDAIT